MKRLVLIAAACGSPPAKSPPPPPPPAAPTASPLGGACSPKGPSCSAGLQCVPMPGGYCTAPCGDVGAACSGTCVETWRGGELCMTPCSSETDCRDGYACDPTWHACTLPVMTAMKPKACAATDARDPAFGKVDRLSTKAMPGDYQFEPSAVVTGDGGVVAMYISRAGIRDPNQLGTSTLTRTDVPFAAGRDTAFDPWLARDSKGTIYAVWLGFDGAVKNQQIGFATSPDGLAWSAPVSVEDVTCEDGDDCLDKPMVAVGKGDVVYVMFAAADGLRVRASTDRGKTWSAGVQPLKGIYGNPAVSPDGRLHLVTVDGGPEGTYGTPEQAIEYTASADNGATFAPPATVSAAGESIPFFFSNPSVVADDTWIYVAYARGDKDGAWDIALAASKDKGKTWTRTAIADGCTHLVPNLALDRKTGTLHVAYYDSHGSGRFVHAMCTQGLSSCKETGAINDAPFAALSTERHGSKWIGEYESLVVDDKRRILHAVWSQPVRDGDHIATRIFHAQARL